MLHCQRTALACPDNLAEHYNDMLPIIDASSLISRNTQLKDKKTNEVDLASLSLVTSLKPILMEIIADIEHFLVPVNC